ncbi:fasciclin domain-containing protein [Psychroflexus montanilacus]|uniref:fasciclin domain-containing protein n=1 Tax=Psychroflexus montanilacus TaxID=2873598 RepID=UPI001CCC0B51|nr:fasciclin domain-containing protein [Psychroflexus montanilacus]MBZ9651958.1 fasciclin domain-containing protein [Psychroflexus montanilacus]
MKNYFTTFILLTLFTVNLTGCYNDDNAGEPINNEPTTFEIIQESTEHTILEQLLTDTGLDAALNSGTFTIFAPTDEAFGNIDTSGLTDAEVENILLNHVVESAAESSNLQTSYLNTLATETGSGAENNLSLYVNVGASITLNGNATVTGPDNFASNGVVHVVDQVITLPDVTTFATVDPSFETLLQALTRDDQQEQNYVELLSSSEDPAPFTVFAPTNDAFASLLSELDIEDLAGIDGETLTSVLNTHVIAGANITSSDLEDGTVETIGETFELNGTTITDQNGRTIQIEVTDVQASNGVIHVVSSVILPDLGLDPPTTNTVAMTVENDAASAYFVSEINGNEEVTALNENNSTWSLTVGTRYTLTVTGANAHPFELRNTSGDALLSQSNEGSFENDGDVNFVTDGQQFDFTLTSELANEIADYVCTVHGAMRGDVTINE